MMQPSNPNMLVRDETNSVFERMFRAVELVKQRLDRTCIALRNASVPYAVIGGNAVAAWVATIDDGAVRNTRDVDILLREQDLDLATIAMESAGFVRDSVMDVIVFLDGPDGKPSQGIHVLLAERKVRDGYSTATPRIDQAVDIEGRSIVELAALVEMKLNSFRDKDRTHLRDMIQIGLIDSTWPVRFAKTLGDRLQELLHSQEAFALDHRIEEVLQGLGFVAEDYGRTVDTFSGGQQSRLMLAKMLLASPDVLLLDEPSNHLDIQTTRWLEDYLMRQSEGMLIVSHDRYFLNRVVNKIFELNNCQIESYVGNFDAYIRQRRERFAHPHTVPRSHALRRQKSRQEERERGSAEEASHQCVIVPCLVVSISALSPALNRKELMFLTRN